MHHLPFNTLLNMNMKTIFRLVHICKFHNLHIREESWILYLYAVLRYTVFMPFFCLNPLLLFIEYQVVCTIFT